MAGLPVLESPKEVFWATQQVDSFIADRLPFRNRIISGLYWFRREILHDYIFPQVVIGRNNWLFYSSQHTIDFYQKVLPFNQEQLENIRQNLEVTQAWLSARNILMVVVIAPEKDVIYPEYLPESIPVIGKLSQVDQLLDYMSEKSDVRILDLRPAVFERKKTSQTYYMSDTHWNRVGCHAGYEEIMREIARKYPNLRPYPLTEYESTTNLIQDDLWRFIGQVNNLEIDPYYIEQKSPIRAQLVASDNGYWSEMTVNDPSLPRLVMFRDSFGFCLIPFLAEHFSDSLFQWAWAPTTNIVIDQEMIEQYNPDIVIIELVDRYISLRLIPIGNTQTNKP
jgi:alginate O-acetyltransferase complex protein AlgJ